MYRYSVKLLEDLSQNEQLPHDQIEDVDLNSPLGILLSSLKGNFVRAIKITKEPKLFLPSFSVPEFPDRKEEDAQFLRKDFFKQKSRSFDGFIDLGEKESMSEKEFQILCDFLKEANSLQDMHLHGSLGLNFTAREEQQLATVMVNHPSINNVVLSDTTQELANAVKEIGKSSLRIEGRTNLFRRMYDECGLLGSQHHNNLKKDQTMFNMYLLQGFVAALGVAAVAVALVCLSLSTLNPAAVLVAASGTAAMAWSVYSFFTAPLRSEPAEPPFRAEATI